MSGFRRSQASSPFLLDWDALNGWTPAGQPVLVDGAVGVFTRAGIKRVADRAGRLVPIGYGAPARSHRYDAASGLVSFDGALLEAAATNLHSNSQVLGTDTTLFRATVAASDVALAPDGSLTADFLKEDNTTNTRGIYKATDLAIANATPYTFTVCLKPAGRTWVALQGDVAGGYLGTPTFFHLTGAGAIGTTGAGVVPAIEALANGWYRCSVAKVSSNVTAKPGFFLADADNSTNYAGDNASGVYVWGRQFTAGLARSSYVLTGAGTATRAADGLYLPFAALPRAMTIYVRFVERGTSQVGSDLGLAALMDAAGDAPYLAVYAASATGKYVLKHDNGATADNRTAGTAPSYGDLVELRCVVNADGSLVLGQALNSGAEAVTGTSGAVPFAGAWSGPRIYVNTAPASAAGLVAVQRLRIAAGVRTLDELRAGYWS